MNKTIWINWFQGWDNAPEITHKCVESWKYYNPEWNIVLLSNDNYSQYADFEEKIPGINTNNIDKSDILRISLLANHGGVWADSTLFCNKPLDSWIHDYEDYFVFTRADNIMDNWFMMAQGDRYIAKRMYQMTIDYWKGRIAKGNQEELIWCWQISFLRNLLSSDQRTKDIIGSWDHLDCAHDVYNRQKGHGWRGRGGHFFTPYYQFFYEPVTEEFKNRIDAKIDPVYKLTYKEQTDWKPEGGYHPDNRKIMLNYPEDSQLWYLLNTVL